VALLPESEHLFYVSTLFEQVFYCQYLSLVGFGEHVAGM